MRMIVISNAQIMLCFFSIYKFPRSSIIICRIKGVNAMNSTITAEYHGQQLVVDASLLGDLGQFHSGKLFQFLGELERDNDKVRLVNLSRLLPCCVPNATVLTLALLPLHSSF